MRDEEPGFRLVAMNDPVGRRGIWMRELDREGKPITEDAACDAAERAGMELVAGIELVAGREGDDEAVVLRVGDAVTGRLLSDLHGVLSVGQWQCEGIDRDRRVGQTFGKAVRELAVTCPCGRLAEFKTRYSADDCVEPACAEHRQVDMTLKVVQSPIVVEWWDEFGFGPDADLESLDARTVKGKLADEVDHAFVAAETERPQNGPQHQPPIRIPHATFLGRDNEDDVYVHDGSVWTARSGGEAYQQQRLEWYSTFPAGPDSLLAKPCALVAAYLARAVQEKEEDK